MIASNPAAGQILQSIGSSTGNYLEDSSTNRWFLINKGTSGFQIAMNDPTDPNNVDSATNVVLLEYNDSDTFFYYQNVYGQWFKQQFWKWGWQPTTNPNGAVAGSPSDTVVTNPSEVIVDTAYPNVWSMSASGSVTLDGFVDDRTSGVTKLAWVGGSVYHETGAGTWFVYNESSNSWAQANDPLPAPPPPPPPGKASADYTAATGVKDPPVIDPKGNEWTLVSGYTGQMMLAVNGKALTDTLGTTTLAILAGSIYRKSAGGVWLESTNGGPWVTPAKPIVPCSLKLSA